jgi:hypothetical protein
LSRAASQSWIFGGEPIFVVDTHRDSERFIVRADEKLTAFVELESEIVLPDGFRQDLCEIYGVTVFCAHT